MKRFLKFLPLILAAVILLSSCAGKYDEFPSSSDDLREVGTVKSFSVYYDEFRCAVMTAKKNMTEESGIDWTSGDAENHRSALESRVLEGLKYNYAVLALFAETGYTIENANIQNSVRSQIKALIDECGSREKYSEYLEENFLTDRVLRQTIAINCAVNELVYSLCDTGAFEEYIDFDIEAISFGETFFSLDEYSKAMDFVYSGTPIIRTQHLILPENTTEAEAVELFDTVKELTDISKAEHGDDVIVEDFYQIAGERAADYFGAASKLAAGEKALVSSGGRWYIVQRLEPDPDYLNENYFDIIFKYLLIKTNEHIAEYEKTFEIALTDFGKSLDMITLD